MLDRQVSLTDYTGAVIENFPISGLAPYPGASNDTLNPREKFDVSTLADSIQREGIQNPLHVILFEQANGEPTSAWIVDGERRWRACQKIGRKTVPVYVVRDIEARDDDDLEAEYVHHMMLLHNNREQLLPMEMATALKTQLGFGKTILDLSKAYSLSVDKIGVLLALLDAPEFVQKRVNSGDMSLSAFKKIKDRPALVQQEAAELEKPTVSAVTEVAKRNKENAGRIDDMLDTFDVDLAVYTRIKSLQDEISASWVNFTANEQAQIVARLKKLHDRFNYRSE